MLVKAVSGAAILAALAALLLIALIRRFPSPDSRTIWTLPVLRRNSASLDSPAR